MTISARDSCLLNTERFLRCTEFHFGKRSAWASPIQFAQGSAKAQTPEARVDPSWLGEGPECSSVLTLWRTSDPCTQKMTSSAMLVA